MLQSGSMSSSNNSWSTEEEKDMANRFPLHRACRDGNLVELRDLLGQLQANIHNSKLITAEDDKYRWTAAHFSAYFGRVECLRLLMQAVSVYNPERSRHNLDPISCPLNTTTSSCSQTPLHVAAFANHPRCVEWLLQSGAHIHTQDSSGETALHKACRSGAREVLKVLATYKADCTTRNAKGLTAAEVAAASGHTDIAELITGTPTQSQAPLVSTNGYYGYQPPSVKGAPDLLASEAVAKDLIAVAGRKRGREEEDNCSNKRGRYQGGAEVTFTSSVHGSSSSSSSSDTDDSGVSCMEDETPSPPPAAATTTFQTDAPSCPAGTSLAEKGVVSSLALLQDGAAAALHQGSSSGYAGCPMPITDVMCDSSMLSYPRAARSTLFSHFF